MPNLPSTNETLYIAVKKYAIKQISEFSSPLQFHSISLICSKCFVHDCLNKQYFAHNLFQSSRNFIF